MHISTGMLVSSFMCHYIIITHVLISVQVV